MTSEDGSSSRLSLQLLVVVLGLVLWLVRPSPELWTLVAAYGAAWLLVNLLIGRRRLKVPLSKTALAAVVAVLVAAPLAALLRQRYDMALQEGWRGLPRYVADRARLEKTPAIAPPVVFTDHPQSFYIAAPGAEDVRLAWGEDTPELPSEALGQGLFRVRYDPRQHGPPTDGPANVEARILTDGRAVRREVRAVQPEAHPRFFASAPERGLAATVSEETDEVFVVSRQGLEQRFTVDDGPTDCAFVADDGLAVSHRYSPALLVVDPLTGDIRSRFEIGRFQVRLAASPGGELLAVALAGLEPGVRVVEVASGRVVGEVALEHPPEWITFGRNASELVVSSTYSRELYRLSRSEEGWTLDETIHLGRPAVSLGRAPDGRRLYAAVTDYRPSGENHRGNHFIQDQILTVDLGSFTVVDQYLTARRSSRQVRAGSIDRGVSPMGITVRADGTLLVAFAGTDEVWELDTELALPPTMFWGLDLDLIAPHGVADLGDGYWAASSPAGGSMAVFTRTGEMVTYIGVTPTDDELTAGGEGSLAVQARDHRYGEWAFYESTRTGISCQSCHLHADSDHSPQAIGQTPLLPTLTVRGVARTAPYLRDGSFPRVRDLDTHLSQTLLRGFRRFAPGRPELLESFVESLPRLTNPRLFEDADLERERAGAAAFVKAECSLCHNFPAFTNLSQHPVRTLFPDYGAGLAATVSLDTPALLDVHAKGHLLQDGRAHDLHAVLGEHNEANRHGNSAVLSDDERDALVHFLKSL